MTALGRRRATIEEVVTKIDLVKENKGLRRGATEKFGMWARGQG